MVRVHFTLKKGKNMKTRINAKRPKMVVKRVSLPISIWESMADCVSESPLDFQNVTDFVRYAVRKELIRRKKYNDSN